MQSIGRSEIGSIHIELNDLVNELAYKNDIDNFGRVDHWAGAEHYLPGVDLSDWEAVKEALKNYSGDCDDYASLKRDLLRHIFPHKKGAFPYLECWVYPDKRQGSYHCVCGVNIDDKMYILDNFYYPGHGKSYVKRIDKLPYVWNRIEDPNTNTWHTITIL